MIKKYFYFYSIDSSVSTNSDLTTQLMNDLQANGKGTNIFIASFLFKFKFI